MNTNSPTSNLIVVSNLTMALRVVDDGTVRFCSPLSREVSSGWVDAEYDIGIFAAGEYLLFSL
jgi:hypothetical protein